METLWTSIIMLCWRYGEVDGLNRLSETIGTNYALTWKRLAWLEQRDPRLRVVHIGRGRNIKITYEFDPIPNDVSIPVRLSDRKFGVITFRKEKLYPAEYAGRTN